MVAGVSGGLARYFDIHPAFFRVGFVVLTLLGGAGILIYLAAALVMPDEGKEDSFATAILKQRRDRPWPLIGLALVAVAFISVLSHATLWPHGDAWFLLLIAGVAILWVTRHSVGEPPADPAAVAVEDSRRVRRLFKGIAIAFATVVALALVAAAAFASSVHLDLGNGTGDKTYVVENVGDLQRSYKLGIGELTLDLRNVTFPAGETRIRTRVDIGHLHVIVPNGVAVRGDSDAIFGEVNMLGRNADGHNASTALDENGTRVLVLDADVGAGRIDVDRAVR
jgi:phage shock protein PspC (stress-responsive transcriptional regulator)